MVDLPTVGRFVAGAGYVPIAEASLPSFSPEFRHAFTS
jgi:hypothetical protein